MPRGREPEGYARVRVLKGWTAQRERIMRNNYRIAGMAAIVVLLGAAGLSAADNGRELKMAQRVTTGSSTEGPAVQARGEVAATVFDKQDVQAILGRQVLSSAGEDMGRVIDIVVDRNGQVRAAVIDFGGFLGVGNRRVAIDWNALRFAPTGSKYDRITLDLTREQLKDAPDYKDGRPLVVLGAAESLPAPD
jgi:sporulation protein YlmC with PRC-barrel domain